MKIYERPKNNLQRFELVKKWFEDRNFDRMQKCVFMGWTEEFFSQFANFYLTSGEESVQELKIVADY